MTRKALALTLAALLAHGCGGWHPQEHGKPGPGPGHAKNA